MSVLTEIEDMEDSDKLVMRKVQKLGTSSMIITIPRSWARKHRISVGSLVSVYEDGDRLIISPNEDGSILKASFSTQHNNVCKHAGRIVLCSYISGLDSIVLYSNRPFRNDVLEKVSQVAEKLPFTESGLLSEYEFAINFKDRPVNVVDTLLIYGRSLSSLLSKLTMHLDGAKLIGGEIESNYEEMKSYGYKLLRIASKGHGQGLNDEHVNRLLSAAVGLLILANDSLYRLALDLVNLSDYLDQDEKERIKFLLQLLEVSIVTSTSSINPPSIKKEEEAYWKLRTILGLEEDLKEIIENTSGIFGYLLSTIINIARIVNNVEETLLCYSIFEKYSE
ncbi:AbrB/MazE/SpoVT family DNA-binding domain-containing protein [Caldisphaera sp.]|uniref:AbrB/MazE/SpoVT family DNA-binding domain-containing protein n=1 Tax=Caldisphaera sp. TaxID=2060322 RepID=UPI003D0D63E4